MKTKHKELPQLLVLKRTFTQRFPNGQQVALYHSEALDQYITIPLDGSQFSNTTESVLEQLKQISQENIVESILFKDLSELNINKECADIILNYIDSGNIQEEQLLSLIDSDKEFLNILESAVQNSQQDSEEESEEKQELQQ